MNTKALIEYRCSGASGSWATIYASNPERAAEHYARCAYDDGEFSGCGRLFVKVKRAKPTVIVEYFYVSVVVKKVLRKSKAGLTQKLRNEIDS